MINRRNLLSAALAVPVAGMVGGMRAFGQAIGDAKSGRVIVRDAGGSYSEGLRKAIWEPFAAETGIQVVPFAAPTTRIFAMAKANNLEIDLIDLSEGNTSALARTGALASIDPSVFRHTNPNDLDGIRQHYVWQTLWANVLVYNSHSFQGGAPNDWKDFWNVGKFPGARTLQSMTAATVYLEFALLADGVAVDHLYPLDVDRAFRKLSEIKPHILKWWDSGAIAAQIFADEQVVLGGVWHTRIQPLIDSGHPVTIEWNQASLEATVLSVPKGAPNRENAFRLLDYSLLPEVQAKVAILNNVGPTNRRAFEHLDAAVAAKLPTSPQNVSNTFVIDADWWVDNRERVAERWQTFLLN